MNAAKNTLHSFKRLSALSVGVIAFVGMAAFSSANAQATTTTATSSAPMISGIALTGGGSGIVTMHWMTDTPATSQVMYGPIGMAYSSSTPLNSTLVTSHAVMVGGLASGPLYHFSVSSANVLGMLATSTDRAFVLVGSTGTSTTGTSTTATSTGPTGSGGTGTGTSTTATSTTATSTDISFLQHRIWQLEGLVEWLRDQIALLQGTNNGGGGSGTGGGTGGTGNSGGGTGGTGTTTTDNDNDGGNGGGTTGGGSSSGQMGTLTPNNASVRAGTTIDIGGRGFAPNQDYTVMTNGQRVGAAHSDSGGNFSTGSLPVSRTVGSQTYSLTGPGGTMQVTVNVIP